jgi:hypothetical protein
VIKFALTVALILFSPAFCIGTNTQKVAARKIIQSIPADDLESLETFFRNILFYQNLAYTLFGDKPISIECFDLENEKKPDVFRTSCSGYRIWERYAYLFPQEHYIFLFYEDVHQDICEITLINKRAFLETVNKHKEIFANLFGPEMTSETLLSLIIQKRSLWNTPMQDRDDLIGILLGYGKSNAHLFQKRSEIWRINTKIKKQRTQASQGYSSVDEELKHLNASLQSFSNEGRFSLNYIRLPSFVADPNTEETVQLKKKYSRQRKWITHHLSQGNLLEILFEQLLTQQE